MSEAQPFIVFEPLFPEVLPPARATKESAGYDLRAHLLGRCVRIGNGISVAERPTSPDTGALVIAPGEYALIPLGFRASLPRGYEAQIRIRSSVAFRKRLIIPNAPGTIDADYPDEWLVMVRNDDEAEVTIEHGERIAQAVLTRFEVLPWEAGTVGGSTGRSGGLDSTGSH